MGVCWAAAALRRCMCLSPRIRCRVIQTPTCCLPCAQESRRAQERANLRKSESDRIKKALPNICRDSGDTLGEGQGQGRSLALGAVGDGDDSGLESGQVTR